MSRTGIWQRIISLTRAALVFIGRPFFRLMILGVNLVLFSLFIIGKTVVFFTQKTPPAITYFTSALSHLSNSFGQLLLSNLRSTFFALRQSFTFRLPLFMLPRHLPFSIHRLNFKALTAPILSPFSNFVAYVRKFRLLPTLPQITLPLPKFSRFRFDFPRIPWQKRPRGRPHKIIFLHRLAGLGVIATVIAIIFTFTIYLPFLRNLPSPNHLITRQRPLTTKILARDGTILFKIYKDQNRTLVPLENIPQSLKLATIAIEDKNFYHHGGFSYRGIFRALRRNIFDQKLQGGSTITQQLVKNALLSPEKTFTRKVREIILSILVELKFSKDEILEMYFNEVAYGGTAYGAEEAAQMYFGKSVTTLNLAEAAFLAGLPAAPTTFSPFGANPELAKIRQAEVLRRMREDGYITAEMAEAAKTLALTFFPQTTPITAPHFVMYVKDLLVKEYGEQNVLQGGLEVHTSLDPQIQAIAEAAVKTEIAKLSRLHITNGAALVTAPRTGEILAMVGSKDYFDFASDGQVNVTTRLRQPGSSIKPINYAVALTNGFTPATIINDAPICYIIPGQKPYCPKNYDNKFHGSVTLRTALASSYNVPAVKTLSVNGVARMIEQGQKMGITTWEDPSRFGLSLTLGGGEVTMVDMAVAYGTLANLGLRTNLHPILKVVDSKGKVLEEFVCKENSKAEGTSPSSAPVAQGDIAQAASLPLPCSATRALSPSVAYQLTSILSDNSARAPAFGSNSLLNIPRHQVAVKTGTTQNLRDNWTIGYTQNFVVATWVGNNDNTPMSYVASGITGASPIWRNIFDTILANEPDQNFTEPQDLIKVKICTLTGQLSCSGCPSREELFLPGTEPKTACTPEQIDQLKQKQQEERDKILTGTSTSQ